MNFSASFKISLPVCSCLGWIPVLSTRFYINYPHDPYRLFHSFGVLTWYFFQAGPTFKRPCLFAVNNQHYLASVLLNQPHASLVVALAVFTFNYHLVNSCIRQNKPNRSSRCFETHHCWYDQTSYWFRVIFTSSANGDLEVGVHTNGHFFVFYCKSGISSRASGLADNRFAPASLTIT